jgi:hypothetical protein
MPSGRLDDGGGGGTVVPDGATFEEAVFDRESDQLGEEQLDYDEFFSTTPEPEGGGADFEIDGETYGSADEFWRDVQNDDSLVTGGDPWQPVRDGAENLNVTVENGLDGLDELLPDWLPWAFGGTLGTILLLVVIYVVGQAVTWNVGGGS